MPLLRFCQRRPQFPEGCFELSGAATPSSVRGRKLRSGGMLPAGAHEVICFDGKSKAP